MCKIKFYIRVSTCGIKILIFVFESEVFIEIRKFMTEQQKNL